MNLPGFTLYPLVAPVGSADLPQAFESAQAKFKAAEGEFAVERFSEAASLFADCGSELRSCLPTEHGVRTPVLWNALLSLVSAADVTAARAFVADLKTSDESCWFEVSSLFNRLAS